MWLSKLRVKQVVKSRTIEKVVALPNKVVQVALPKENDASRNMPPLERFHRVLHTVLNPVTITPVGRYMLDAMTKRS